MNNSRQDEFIVRTDTGMDLMVVSKVPETGRLGNAVLLVHGSGVGWIYWDIPFEDYSIMNFLVDRGLDVYAVECRGYGRSTKPNGMEVTAGSMAEDLKSVTAAIVEKSGVGRVSLVGHSSGGTVLLLAGHLYPELLARMVLIGTPYRKINPQFLEYANSVINMAREPGKDYVPNLHYKDIEARLDTYDEDVVAWYKKTVEEQYCLMPGGLFPDIIDNPAIHSIPDMMVPTLIINGSNEYVVDFDDATDLFHDLGTPDKSMVIQPESHHLLFLEKMGHIGLQESIFFWITKSQ